MNESVQRTVEVECSISIGIDLTASFKSDKTIFLSVGENRISAKPQEIVDAVLKMDKIKAALKILKEVQ